MRQSLIIMDTLIVDVGQYLPFLIAIVAGIIWLFLPRRDKVGLAVQAIVALLIAVVLIQLAAHVHHGQDIGAGVVIAAVAVGVTTAGWAWVRPRLTGQRAEFAPV